MASDDIERQFDVDVSIEARHYDFGPDAYRFNAKVTQIIDVDTFGLVIDQDSYNEASRSSRMKTTRSG